jgi:hypothetical protein
MRAADPMPAPPHPALTQTLVCGTDGSIEGRPPVQAFMRLGDLLNALSDPDSAYVLLTAEQLAAGGGALGKRTRVGPAPPAAATTAAPATAAPAAAPPLPTPVPAPAVQASAAPAAAPAGPVAAAAPPPPPPPPPPQPAPQPTPTTVVRPIIVNAAPINLAQQPGAAPAYLLPHLHMASAQRPPAQPYAPPPPGGLPPQAFPPGFAPQYAMQPVQVMVAQPVFMQPGAPAHPQPQGGQNPVAAQAHAAAAAAAAGMQYGQPGPYAGGYRQR